MDADVLRALLKAHPAVAIPPFGGPRRRTPVVCVRAGDAARLAADAGLEPTDAEIEAAMTELGASRLRLVDPAGEGAPRGGSGAARPTKGRGRPARPPRGVAAGRRGGAPLEELDVYELPASVFDV